MSSNCINCPKHPPRVSAGWLSPNNHWFPNVVMIRLCPDCPCRAVSRGAAAPECGYDDEAVA